MSPETNGAVSVLIVNWNTRDLLRNCLASLGRTANHEQLEIVVIDNASVDDSVDMVRSEFPGVTLIENDENQGFGRANNQGFAASSAPYVLFLNSDAEVSTDAIETCRSYLDEHDDVGLVGCRIEYPNGDPQNSVFRYPSLRSVVSASLFLAQLAPNNPALNYDRYGGKMPEKATSVDVVMGSFILARRLDLEPEPFDDSYFMYAEEADLARRLAERGKKTIHLPEATIVHQRGASSRTWAQRAWSEEAKRRAQLRFLRKWEGGPTAYVANLVFLAFTTPRLVGWALADARAQRAGQPTGRLLKARALRFHIGAMFRPSLMDRRFHGPPTSDDE